MWFLVNETCVLFPCHVVILRKDNLTWRVWDTLSFTRCLRLLRNCKKFVSGCARGFAVHPDLELALCTAVPEGNGLGEMCRLSGSNEGDSREGREKKNARKGTCLAPSPGMHARERDHEQTKAEKRGRRRWNQISKERQRQTLIMEKRANYEKQMKSRVRHLI